MKDVAFGYMIPKDHHFNHLGVDLIRVKGAKGEDDTFRASSLLGETLTDKVISALRDELGVKREFMVGFELWGDVVIVKLEDHYE